MNISSIHEEFSIGWTCMWLLHCLPQNFLSYTLTAHQNIFITTYMVNILKYAYGTVLEKWHICYTIWMVCYMEIGKIWHYKTIIIIKIQQKNSALWKSYRQKKFRWKEANRVKMNGIRERIVYFSSVDKCITITNRKSNQKYRLKNHSFP